MTAPAGAPEPFRAPNEPFQRAAPTTSTRKFITATFVSAAMFGTISYASPADIDAARAATQVPRTLPANPVDARHAIDGDSIADLLLRIRDGGDLTWGEIAQALSVSRRTVHNWLSHAQVARVHQARLSDLDALVTTMNTGDPGSTRLRLIRPGAFGRSALDDFGLASRPRRQLPLTTVTAGDLIDPGDDVSTADTPTRRSTLKGGPMKRRPTSS